MSLQEHLYALLAFTRFHVRGFVFLADFDHSINVAVLLGDFVVNGI